MFLTYEGKTSAFLITGQDALWKKSAFGTSSKHSQYCISAGSLRGRSHLMWCMHHLNGCELLGLEPGALSVQRSAGECAILSFLGKLMDFSPTQIEIIEKFEKISHQEGMSLRSQQFIAA